LGYTYSPEDHLDCPPLFWTDAGSDEDPVWEDTYKWIRFKWLAGDDDSPCYHEIAYWIDLVIYNNLVFDGSITKEHLEARGFFIIEDY
jgi:hypothetical protein